MNTKSAHPSARPTSPPVASARDGMGKELGMQVSRGLPDECPWRCQNGRRKFFWKGTGLWQGGLPWWPFPKTNKEPT